MKVLLVAGARPNFMKVAPVMAEVDGSGDEAVLVHTGQHYGSMSDSFFRDLGMRAPDFHLGVGSGSHAAQTGRVMEAFEPVLLETRPDWVVVVGDVNSTLACALVAAKLKEETGSRIAHIEAGLRSGDWRMPEEVNRVLTDRLADLLLTPSADALPNLLAEGIPEDRIAFVGNVMIDALFAQADRTRDDGLMERLGVRRGGYVLATMHRPSNVDDPETLGAVLEAFSRLADEIPVVFPVHPRTRKSAESFGLEEPLARSGAIEPVGYAEMVALIDGAAAVLTDSGGLQEETTALGVPCVTLREQTERPVTITEGTNRLAPWPLTRDGVIGAARDALSRGRVPRGSRCPDGWDGRAAGRIVDALRSRTPHEPTSLVRTGTATHTTA